MLYGNMKGKRVVSDIFLELPPKDQIDILNIYAQSTGRDAVVLEKDVWVCWVLQNLFAMPDRLPMAFKGGTALSKVYNIIERFSEDCDITIDYRGFSKEINEDISKSALKKLSEELKQYVATYSKTVVKPYFEKVLAQPFPAGSTSVEVSDDGEKLWIHYPSVLDEPGQRYMAPNILIEFGGRNITEPNEQHIVRPYLADTLSNVKFPEANVIVLSLARAFWEKATLIHVECNRKEPRVTANRLSRHWYDMACLAVHEKGKEAQLDRNLLADVIKYKKLFYNSSYANYDACLKSALRLVPEDILLDVLEQDFEQMLDSGMFYGKQTTFSKIIETIKLLEQSINS
jgi:Nucleotidyl transferase AbiEii toxin, Type IV TA system